jgi:hypothetical protein
MSNQLRPDMSMITRRPDLYIGTNTFRR